MTKLILNFARDKSRMFACLVLLPTLTASVADVYWLFELTCHFRLQYLVAAVVCTCASLALRDGRWAAIGLLSVVVNGFAIAPSYFGISTTRPTAGFPLRLLLCNVYTANLQSAPLLSLIQRERPDLVILQEVNERWMADLESLRETYPFSTWITREDNFGIAVLSRGRLIDPREVDLESEVPTILTDVHFGSQAISLLASHPLPPGSRSAFDARNAQLRGLAAVARQLKNPTILIGDLNVTPWSPDYQRLLRNSGLRDARRGHGILPTWPSFFPLLMIPLDHCLVSASLTVAGIRVGPKVGSDHLPLIVDLEVQASGPN